MFYFLRRCPENWGRQKRGGSPKFLLFRGSEGKMSLKGSWRTPPNPARGRQTPRADSASRKKDRGREGVDTLSRMNEKGPVTFEALSHEGR